MSLQSPPNANRAVSLLVLRVIGENAQSSNRRVQTRGTDAPWIGPQEVVIERDPSFRRMGPRIRRIRNFKANAVTVQYSHEKIQAEQ